jgi:hypothetical protein
MLDGELSYLLGARRLAALRHEAEIKDGDEDFMIFVAIDSDTDDLPLGPVRAHWDKQALERLQPEIEAAETWAKAHAESVCTKLIGRFN